MNSGRIIFCLLFVFLYSDMLTEEDHQLVEFGIGGICNLCLGESSYCFFFIFNFIL